MPAHVDQLSGRRELPALTRDADALIQNAGGEKRHDHTAAKDAAHAPIVDRGEGGRNLRSFQNQPQCVSPGFGFGFFS